MISRSFNNDLGSLTPAQSSLNRLVSRTHNFMECRFECAYLLLHILKIEHSNLEFARLLKYISHHNGLNIEITVDSRALSPVYLDPHFGCLVKYIDINDGVALGNVPQCDKQLNLL
jgi:hypothetical protein